jgi:O-methyltransferase
VVKAGGCDTYYKGGEHADTSVEIVKGLVSSLALPNVRILHGVFPEDTGNQVPGKIALLHCDVDVYASTRDIVEWALPRLSPGAMLVFDDYGFYGCEGVTRYCNEFRKRDGFRFIHNLNGHAIFIKVK